MHNKKSVIKINDFIIYAYLFATIFSTIFLKNIIYTQENYLVINTIFLILLLFFNFKCVINTNTKDLMLTTVFIAFLFIEKFFNNTGIGSTLVLINLAIIFLLVKSINISKKNSKHITIFFFISSIVFLFTNNSMFNPNTNAYIFLCMSIIGLCCLNKKIIKIAYLIIMSIAIFYTESRTSLIAELVMIVFSTFNLEKIIKPKKYKIIILVLFILSIAFIYIYTTMWKNNFILKLSFSEKNFYSGRQFIWLELIEALKGHYLFGLGSNHILHSFSSFNAHNSLFAVLSIHGIITFTLFTFLFYRCIIKVNTSEKYTKIKYNISVGIISILIVSWTENSLIQPIFSIYIFIMLLLGINENSFLEKTTKKVKKGDELDE